MRLILIVLAAVIAIAAGFLHALGHIPQPGVICGVMCVWGLWLLSGVVKD